MEQERRDQDPAFEAVEEAGGGESEGFEQAEAELERQATHDEPGTSPTQEAFGTEEADAADAEYGEADHADPDD